MGHIDLSLATENLCNIQLTIKTIKTFVTLWLSPDTEENGYDFKQTFSFFVSFPICYSKIDFFESGHNSSLFCKYLPFWVEFGSFYEKKILGEGTLVEIGSVIKEINI